MRISDWSSDVCSSDLRAIEITIQDFTVFDGIRSVKEQQQHVANGTSQTMKSKHLDGLAVDLVPWVGKPVWEWDRIYPIAFAMDQAGNESGLESKNRWGGARSDEHTAELKQLMRIAYDT